MFICNEEEKEYFIVSVKESNVREMQTLLFETPSRGTSMKTKELIYDYCDSNDMVILFIDHISKEYYNTHTNCRTL